MGCDRLAGGCRCNSKRFQSTQPEWAATVTRIKSDSFSSNFNPRSPNGLRLFAPRLRVSNIAISIHAARMGCDKLYPASLANCCIFQSTQPEWAATDFFLCRKQQFTISIHAARMGCDPACGLCTGQAPYFNPRSPNGLRQISGTDCGGRKNFNPRSPNGLRQLPK